MESTRSVSSPVKKLSLRLFVGYECPRPLCYSLEVNRSRLAHVPDLAGEPQDIADNALHPIEGVIDPVEMGAVTLLAGESNRPLSQAKWGPEDVGDNPRELV